MKKAYEDVREFHKMFGLTVADSPQIPENDVFNLHKGLIDEEDVELNLAFGYDAEGRCRLREPDMVKIADALADSIYVRIGAALAFGIPIHAIWEVVQESNMSKVGGPIREDGKVMKPSDWKAPDILSVLIAYGWRDFLLRKWQKYCNEAATKAKVLGAATLHEENGICQWCTNEADLEMFAQNEE